MASSMPKEELKILMDRRRAESQVEDFNYVFDTLGGRTPFPPPPLKLFPEDPLLLPTPSLHSPLECPNTQHRPLLWTRFDDAFIKRHSNPNATFPNRVAQLCIQAEIYDCHSPTCEENRRAMERAVPECGWESLRRWALVAMSCQASMTEQQIIEKTANFYHLSIVGSIWHYFMAPYHYEPIPITDNLIDPLGNSSRVDLTGICEVLYWMITIQGWLELGSVIEGRWSPEFLPQNIVLPGVTQACERAKKLGLCANRIWNLAAVSERKQCDLHGLMESARKFPGLRHLEDHGECTSAECSYGLINSTFVKQLHKCQEKNCGQIKFPPGLIEESLMDPENGNTAWSCHGEERSIIKKGQNYMAVSHVWADGTGIGLVEAGQVNSCLWNYFVTIAQRLNCSGIWWDTISIPTEPVLRRVAINKMHANYECATVTVVHDSYLLQFPWADDGSPCLALVLSPWYTRGWTALELHISKTVKVLFKDPNNPDTPVIKDLDEDILAKSPTHVSRGHWIASSLIRQLRKPIERVGDLLSVLQLRTTSWSRDRMIIAGLLARLPENYDYSSHSQAEITRDIITHIGLIGTTSILHSNVSMRERGGFSWCPRFLYDMPADSTSGLISRSIGVLGLKISKEGILTGPWYYRFLTSDDAKAGVLMPHSNHLSITLKIQQVLHHWENCLLLREDRLGRGPGLLVTTVEVTEKPKEEWVDVRYVGSVIDTKRLVMDDDKGIVHMYHYARFRIGGEAEGRRDGNARAAIVIHGKL